MKKQNLSTLVLIVGVVFLTVFFQEDISKIVQTFILLLIKQTGSTLYAITVWMAIVSTILFFIVGLIATGQWPTASTILAIYSLPSYLCTLSYASMMGDQAMMKEVNLYLFIGVTLSVLLWIGSTFVYSTEEETLFKDGVAVKKTKRKQVGGKR